MLGPTYSPNLENITMREMHIDTAIQNCYPK
jgi:hypothetical protein